MIFFVMSHSPVEDCHITVEGEAEIANTTCFALFHKPVEESVIKVTLVNGLHSSASDTVQEKVVYVVCSDVFKASFEHCFAFFEVVLRG